MESCLLCVNSFLLDVDRWILSEGNQKMGTDRILVSAQRNGKVRYDGNWEQLQLFEKRFRLTFFIFELLWFPKRWTTLDKRTSYRMRRISADYFRVYLQRDFNMILFYSASNLLLTEIPLSIFWIFLGNKCGILRARQNFRIFEAHFMFPFLVWYNKMQTYSRTIFLPMYLKSFMAIWDWLAKDTKRKHETGTEAIILQLQQNSIAAK